MRSYLFVLPVSFFIQPWNTLIAQDRNEPICNIPNSTHSIYCFEVKFAVSETSAKQYVVV